MNSVEEYPPIQNAPRSHNTSHICKAAGIISLVNTTPGPLLVEGL